MSFPSARRALLLFATAAMGCDSAAPVAWESTHSVPTEGSSLAISATGEVLVDTLAARASTIALPASACAASLRLAQSGTRLFGTWWSPREDSTALLLSSVSVDSGRTWRTPVAVDTTDHGATGCARSAPSIAANDVTGYVHIAYAMQATEGPGLFFAHSMDGGATFHTPVPILYGERLGATSVASSGDEVVVAFEDPGSRTPRIGLALSATMGHIFENRLMPVSDDNSAAVQPLVAVSGNRITVAWRERMTPSGPAIIRLRTGSIR